MSGTNGEPRWLTDDEQQAWRATVNLSQLLMRQLDRDLNVHGLSGHDYEILVALSEAPDSRLRMTELADATSQSRSRLSHQISRMESRGLVRRDNCEGDKRGTFAVLTEPGIDTIRRVAPDHVDNVRRHFIDRLTPRQLEEVSDAFGPIVDYLRKIRDRDLAALGSHASGGPSARSIWGPEHLGTGASGDRSIWGPEHLGTGASGDRSIWPAVWRWSLVRM
ncbi:MAG: MarR family transcriptional regulator [Streptosporangiaceae bacterium]